MYFHHALSIVYDVVFKTVRAEQVMTCTFTLIPFGCMRSCMLWWFMPRSVQPRHDPVGDGDTGEAVAH